MRFQRALVPFAVVAGLGLAVLAVDTVTRRPVPIPAPVTADSLAGVVARVVGGDSASVARIAWFVAPVRVLRWSSSDEYAYRNIRSGQLVPIGAEADVRHFRITFAQGQTTAENIKHEIGHLFLRTTEHPATAFQRLEAYRGR